jgi:AcrR family transcriptional regulator
LNRLYSDSHRIISLIAVSTKTRRYELKARAERQRETRRRIVEATADLHREVGPARTTVADIARRAGVQRLTVYNHFPEEGELFAACQAHFLSEHPPPDLGPALALEDPRARTRAVLAALYESYRDREPTTAKVLRDRTLLPALDGLLERTMDTQLAELGDTLAAGFPTRGARRHRVRALVGLALDFWTWRRLTRQGLDDASAAELMAEMVAATSAASSRRARAEQ